MSSSDNFDSVANQGEFRNRVPPSKPLTTKGHAVGVKVGNDAAPEFSAQTLPAGTAPSDRTFNPNPVSETPGQADNPEMDTESRTSAADTINGASSADVHQGLGLPVQGQSSQQLHGSGLTKGAKEGNGLIGVGAIASDPVRERGLDNDIPKGTRGKSGENREDILGAEEREPVGAEAVAAERD
ncbi:hypothetical protein D0Z07_1375 [Hyphodiscus hymeniophilus]|uniref:Uncharacterized protein n=1 Tax=Hyphodiscus hymeniophilus TaxID=353542 RepID=A0A9P6VPZ4_9HELO|nr:hypothetical protein D0Z07_1375 [Hyphodiscus hymeniophilus]